MDYTVASPKSKRVYWTTEDIEKTISENKIVVFAKGKRNCPRCGFSKKVVTELSSCGKPFRVVDVLEDRSIAAALRSYAGRKLLPVVFVNGAVASSMEDQESALSSGELRERVLQA